MRQLMVSDLNRIASDTARMRPDHVLSILDPETTPPDLDLPAGRHRILRCLDLDTVDGPSREDVAAIRDFAAQCGPDDRVIVHCHAGVSRSPAAALILRQAWDEPLDIGPDPVMPNLRMLALADPSLRLMRHGRALGRAAESRPGDMPF